MEYGEVGGKMFGFSSDGFAMLPQLLTTAPHSRLMVSALFLTRDIYSCDYQPLKRSVKILAGHTFHLDSWIRQNEVPSAVTHEGQ